MLKFGIILVDKKSFVYGCAQTQYCFIVFQQLAKKYDILVFSLISLETFAGTFRAKKATSLLVDFPSSRNQILEIEYNKRNR